MKSKFFKLLLLGLVALLGMLTKTQAQVVFTALAGNASSYLAKGATNQVVFGFSVSVPIFSSGNYSPGPLHIAITNNLNGIVSGNLVQTAGANPTFATCCPLASFPVALNATIDVTGFNQTLFAGVTYYYYLVLSITNTVNPQPPTVVFSLPASASVAQNSYGAGITVNNSAAASPTYYFTAPVISYATPQTYYVGNTITPLAPSSTSGTVGGYAAATTFATVNNTNGLAIDASNNVYVTSTTANALYKYNSAGTLQSTQTISSPYGVAVDQQGSTYVASGSTIVKTTSGGTVTTITGFSSPLGVTVDASNNIYVTDNGNGNIYKLSSSSTTAGTAFLTGFTNPWGVAVNTNGDLYVSQYSQNNIIKVASGTSTKTTFVSTGLNSPRGLIFDGAGNLYVADLFNSSIKSINSSGTATTVLSGLNGPTGVVFDSSGNLFVSDYNANAVKKSVASGYTITSGALPAGLGLNAYNGVISGTPTTVTAATNVTIKATNPAGNSSAIVNIAVVNPTAPTAGNVARCGAGSLSPTASGSLPSGGTYNWYTAATGGTLLQSGAATTYTSYTAGTTNYYVSYTAGTYTTARTLVTATINPIVSSPYSGATVSYPFAGNANDVSGNSNNGVLTGAPTLTTDRYSAATSAYNFNGSSQYISTTTPANAPTTFTISLWFNTTTAGGKLIGYGGSQIGPSTSYDRHLYMSSTGQLYFGEYNGSAQSINTANSYNDGNWHHVVVTSSPSGTTLYVDGTSQASGTLNANVIYSGYWRIGYDAISTALYPTATANAFYTGKLDDIAVYNRILTAAEIASSNDINQIGVSTTPVCAGSPISFTAPLITGATYTWTDAGGGTQTGQNPTFTSALSGNYTLSVTGGPGGCTSSATITPNFSTLPSATFTATSPITTGGTSTITYTGTDPASSTYSWTFTGGSPATGTGQGPFNVTYATAGSFLATLNITNAAGCTATASNSVTVNLPPPNISYVTPKTYYVGTAITPLSPTNTGGTASVYNVPTTFTTIAANGPDGVAVNPVNGNIYVSSKSNNSIYIYNAAGTLLSTINSSSTPAATFNVPAGISIDAAGTLYVTNRASGSGTTTSGYVTIITAAGVVSTITGFNEPTDVTTDAAGTIYVTDRASNGGASATAGSVYKLSASATTAGTPYVTGLNLPWGIQLNTAGDIFVSDPGTSNTVNIIYKIPSGSTTPTTFVPTSAGLASPREMTFDQAGNLYVADANSNTVKSITPAGVVTTAVTLPAIPNNPSPICVALDNSGNLFTTGFNVGYIYKSSAGSYSISPALSAGLNFSLFDGTISGTPTATSAATNYTVTASNSGGTSNTVVNITIVNPIAPTAGNVAICGAGSVSPTASGSLPAGGKYNWYSAATGGTLLQSSTATTYTASLVATTPFYVSYTSGTYTTARTPVTATINPIVSSPYSGAIFSYPFNNNYNDISGNANNGYTTVAPGATTDRYNATNSAYSFNGSTQFLTVNGSAAATAATNTFTISIWFNTTTTNGGKLIGFGNAATGLSGSNDRNLYMANNGQLYFGIYPGSVQTINTTASYNDGNWHHAVVTMGASGSTLYVDGVLQATNSGMTTGQALSGWWRIGGDNLNTWTNQPSSYYFSGSLDDIAVYNRVLSAAEISSSNNINQIGASPTPVCAGSAISFNTPLITGATYAWTDPSGATQTGQNPTFASAVVGNYTLTVTGGPGACSSTATITPAINAQPSAAFTATSYVDINSNATITLGTYVASSTYTWTFTGGTPATGTGAGPFSVQWATSGAKTVSLSVTNTSGCTTASTQTVNVNNTTYGNYAFRRSVTLNTTSAAITTNLANFPALLSIQSNDLIISGTCTDKVYIPNGPNYDFAFVDPSSATELYYQIESYNQATGTLLVWVQLPSVNYASNNVISFYYGSLAPTITHNTAFFQNTWTSDYQSVYHFNEAGYTGTTQDGTTNGRTATLVGFQSTDFTTGKIGSAYTFGGTAGAPTVNDMEASASPVSGAFTLSAWVNSTNTSLDEKIITNQDAGGTLTGGYKLGIYFTLPETEGAYNLNRNNTPNPTALSNNTWYYIQGVYNGATLSTYVNGVQYKQQAVTGNVPLTNTLYIGIGEGKNYPFSGIIDEPRVSNVAKTSDWLKMEYVDQNNPVTFTSVNATRITNVTNAAVLPGALTYTWKGVNTSETNANNWDNTTAGITNQLPAFTGNATLVIPTGLTNYPSLTADESIYGITIASGASLNLNGHNLTVGCNIYNASTGTLNWNNNTASAITWNGSTVASQSYNGSTTSATGQIGAMTINNTGTNGKVTITGGGLDIYNLLTITKGNLVIDNANSGTLTLKSVATQSANVAAIPSSYSVSGLINVERFLTGGGSLTNRGYRLLSSPVNQTGITSSLTNSFGINYLNNHVYRNVTYPGAFTAGPGGTTNGFSFTNANPTIYIYRENLVNNNSLFTSGKNVAVTNITTINTTSPTGTTSTVDVTNTQTGGSAGLSLPVGNGFLMYFVGPSTRSDGSTTLAPADATLTAGGYLNQQNITVNLWYSPLGGAGTLGNSAPSAPGYNMVGNPYASTINLGTVLTDNAAGIDNIYLLSARNSPNQIYVAYTANGTSAPTTAGGQYAVSGEGFMVHARASAGTTAVLTFNENEKAPNIQLVGTSLIMSAPQKPVLAVNGLNSGTSFNQLLPIAGTTKSQSTQDGLTGFFMKMEKDSTTYDYCGIYFNDQWHAKFEDGDARDLDGAGPKVYMSSYSSDGIRAAVKHFPDYRKGARIRLYADGKSDGLYNLKIEGIQNIDTNNYKITLLDHFKKDSTDIGRYKTYAFNVLRGDTSTFGGYRFELAIEQLATSKYQLATFTAQKASDGVLVTWRTYNEGNNYFFTLEKQQANGTDFLPVYQLQSNGGTIYKYTDKTPNTGNNVYRLKQVDLFGNITYAGPVSIYYDKSGNAGLFNVYPNPTAETLNVNVTYGKTSSVTTGTYKLNIYDATGALVMQKTSASSNWSENVSRFKPGVYIVELKGNDGNSLGKAKFLKK